MRGTHIICMHPTLFGCLVPPWFQLGSKTVQRQKHAIRVKLLTISFGAASVPLWFQCGTSVISIAVDPDGIPGIVSVFFLSFTSARRLQNPCLNIGVGRYYNYDSH